MKPISALPFLQNAFRPFFLFGTAFAAALVVTWAGMLGEQWSVTTGLPPLLWHAHETVFSFGAVLVVGFVLTASQEWTGNRPFPPAALAGLAALWVLARIVLLLPQHVPHALAHVGNLVARCADGDDGQPCDPFFHGTPAGRRDAVSGTALAGLRIGRRRCRLGRGLGTTNLGCVRAGAGCQRGRIRALARVAAVDLAR